MTQIFSSKIYISLLITFFLFLPTISFSQFKETYVGVNLTSEFGSSLKNGTFGLGVTIERQLTKHSGIETGLYYRTYINEFTFTANNNTWIYSVSEKYISLPLLYKFYSKIVNLSVGPSVDYFAGWSQKSSSSGLKVNAYSVDPNFAFGIQAKASKSFRLNKQLFIEPELRFNRIMPTYRTYFGIGIAMKYQL